MIRLHNSIAGRLALGAAIMMTAAEAGGGHAAGAGDLLDNKTEGTQEQLAVEAATETSPSVTAVKPDGPVKSKRGKASVAEQPSAASTERAVVWCMPGNPHYGIGKVYILSATEALNAVASGYARAATAEEFEASAKAAADAAQARAEATVAAQAEALTAAQEQLAAAQANLERVKAQAAG